MYEAHFGLRANPFAMTPDPAALFWTPTHREALAGLSYALMRRKGFVVLTGPAGTGKTTLLRRLLDAAPVSMRTSCIYNPTLNPSEFLELALADFQLPCLSTSKAQRLLALEQFLLATHREGHAAVLIVDEAHKLSPDLLEEIRLLSNFETAREKLLQIVLAGQPELNTILNRSDLSQLKQRVAVRLHTQPLSDGEILQYLRVRWHKAGGAGQPPFEDAAIRRLTSASRGIPRVINGVCDSALMAAYASGRGVVSLEDVAQVLRDLDIRPAEGPDPPRAGRSAVPSPSADLRSPQVLPRGAALRPAPEDPPLRRVPLERSADPPESALGRWAGKGLWSLLGVKGTR